MLALYSAAAVVFADMYLTQPILPLLSHEFGVAPATAQAGFTFGTPIDWTLGDGGAIPIEERDAAELAVIRGRTATGELVEIEVLPPGSAEPEM